jgi:hypothetical protein
MLTTPARPVQRVGDGSPRKLAKEAKAVLERQGRVKKRPQVISLQARRIRRSALARYRLGRRKFRAAKKRAVTRLLLLTLKARYQTEIKGHSTLAFGGRWLATAAGLFLAAVFTFTLPDSLLSSLKVSEVHLASAGIVGTALALVLSLSIVPAQKAADVFSSAILRLCARDRTTLSVFALLSCSALLSLLFGTGWTFSVSPRYSLAGQLVLLGASLDALRAFYTRALNLLDPATALSLVSGECERYIRRTRDGVEQLVRVQQITSAGEMPELSPLPCTTGRISLLRSMNGRRNWRNLPTRELPAATRKP